MYSIDTMSNGKQTREKDNQYGHVNMLQKSKNNCCVFHVTLIYHSIKIEI